MNGAGRDVVQRRPMESVGEGVGGQKRVDRDCARIGAIAGNGKGLLNTGQRRDRRNIARPLKDNASRGIYSVFETRMTG